MHLNSARLKKSKFKAFRRFKHNNGFTLIEVIIALALLGIVAISLEIGLGTAFKIDGVAKAQTTAMAIAQSQLESIDSQKYIPVPSGQQQVNYSLIDLTSYPGYSIWSYGYDSTSNLVPVPATTTAGPIGIPWDSSTGQVTSGDSGLQKIELIIKQNNNTILTLSEYKAQP